MNEFSVKLRQSRRANKLSQERLAGRAGVSQPYIAELEQGKKMPSVEVLLKLCNTLGCSADYLLGISAARSSVYAQQKSFPGGFTMEMMQEIVERNITPEELNRALRIASVLRE